MRHGIHPCFIGFNLALSLKYELNEESEICGEGRQRDTFTWKVGKGWKQKKELRRSKKEVIYVLLRKGREFLSERPQDERGRVEEKASHHLVACGRNGQQAFPWKTTGLWCGWGEGTVGTCSIFLNVCLLYTRHLSSRLLKRTSYDWLWYCYFISKTLESWENSELVRGNTRPKTNFFDSLVCLVLTEP